MTRAAKLHSVSSSGHSGALVRLYLRLLFAKNTHKCICMHAANPWTVGPSRGPSRGPFRGPLYFYSYCPVDRKFKRKN